MMALAEWSMGQAGRCVLVDIEAVALKGAHANTEWLRAGASDPLSR
jgi:hypothetical protein